MRKTLSARDAPPWIFNVGFYELALEIGQYPASQLGAALDALWSHPSLEGCYLDQGREPSEQTRVTPSSTSLESAPHLYGIAHLPNGAQAACGSYLCREYGGADWLNFYLRMESLAKGYDVGTYPFFEPAPRRRSRFREIAKRLLGSLLGISDREDSESLLQWQRPIDDWLAGIGEHVFSVVRFRLGLIGYEVSGQLYAKSLIERGVPETRYLGILWPSDTTLVYYPRTRAE